MFSIADIVEYFQPDKSVRFCSKEAFGKALCINETIRCMVPLRRETRYKNFSITKAPLKK